MATIGFIGLGNMGQHMTRNLIKAGHSLKVVPFFQAPNRQVDVRMSMKAAQSRQR